MQKTSLVFLCLLLSLDAMCFAASPVSDEAQKQLVSQTQSFETEKKRPPVVEEKKPEIVVQEEKKPPGEEEGPSLFIKKITLEGNTIFPQKELGAIVAPYQNTESSIGRLKTAAQSVTNYYRAKGFLTSRAYLPPQKMEEGIVTIQIVEGKIDKITVEGNKYFGNKLYTEMIRLRKDKIFYYADLENSLYFLNRKPDRTAKAYLVTSETPGASDIILKAEEVNPLHVYYEFNNHGTNLTNRARNMVHVDNNNFSGHDDVFASSVSMSDQGGLGAESISYSLPIESTGTTLGFDERYVQTRLLKHLKPSEVMGKSSYFTPSITQTFVSKPSVLAQGTLGFEIKDSKTIVDGPKINFDRARALVFGPLFTFQDPGGRTILSSNVHWGIPDFLGSSKSVDPNASRVNSGGDFLYYTGSIAQIQRVPLDSFLILRAGGQWTRDTLTALEQYRAGGAYTVRGYPESDSAGDYGYNWSAELNVPVPFLPKNWTIPYNKTTWWDAVRLVGFVDGANIYIRERQIATDVKDRFLLGSGFGVRVNLGNTFSMQLDLGYPLGDASTDKDNKQVHLSLRAGF